jgi:hypothetical protein
LWKFKVKDIFKPHTEPASLIYEAFQTEAEKRNGREPEEWQRFEVLAVLEVANKFVQYATSAGKYKLVTIEDVLKAQRSAYGHADYGAKWAYAVVVAMQIL